MATKKTAKKSEKASSSQAKKSAKKATGGHHYGAQDIQVLEGLEPVRKRPGMYIGSTGQEGVHNLVREIFDNGRDEAMGGFADHIEVVLLPNNTVRVADNGRGIPVDKHKRTNTSALETIMTTLHAGGKFGGDGYAKATGGLHGVGSSVVNALSTHTKVVVHRDGGRYVQEYAIGKPKAKVKKTGSSKTHGTIVSFQPDPAIFEEIDFDWKWIVSHMRQQAYLIKGMKVTLIDARGYEGKIDDDSVFYLRGLGIEAPSETFYFEGGLYSLVRFYNRTQKPIHKTIFYAEKELPEQDASVEIAFQYVDDISARLLPFANNTYNVEGGTHVTGFKTALTRGLNNYARKNNLLKEAEENFTGDDVLEGITAVVSVKLKEIQFEGQTKGKLGSVEARSAVEAVFSDALLEFLEEHPDDAKAIVNKVILALKARKAAKAAKDSVLRKGALEGMTLPGKLADCQTRSADESELFIVEGDSAGGCFSGDTQVALADGRNLSFKELVKEHSEGKQNYCYTMTSEHNVAIAPIHHPRITKKNASLVSVSLDTGEKITCTPDHKFMLPDGTYVEAQQLEEGESLMPLYRTYSQKGGQITIDGYEMVMNPGNARWTFTHKLSDEYNIQNGVYEKSDGDHVHHADFNKVNNNPDNLVRLSAEEHLRAHRDHCEKTLHTKEAKDKARKTHQSDAFRKKMSERMKDPETKYILSKQAKEQWSDPEYKQYMKEKYLEFYYANPEYQEEVRKRLDREQKKYWASQEHRKIQSEQVKRYFENHPEEKKQRKMQADKQWSDPQLRAWRREKTQEQWTPAFREKRKQAYNQTYLRKALAVYREILDERGDVDHEAYEQVRANKNDKTLLRSDTICSRFFDGDEQKLKEAVETFNHKVLSVESVSHTENVYDIEVPGTHNFALASGVFVHNSAKMGRDRRTQAILPLRGKILNVERARLDRMLASAEIKALVIGLGTAIGDTFDIEKLRYGKVIIATDADVDGAHIRTLLLTLFYRYFRPLVDGGHIYIAKPPLHKIKQGKNIWFTYTEGEKDKIVGNQDVEELGDGSASDDESNEGEEQEETEEVKKKKSQKFHIQRYKGLGEMNPEELWETTMNPEGRVLKQVTVDDAAEADRVFDTLMGTDVPARKSFIQTHAREANVDW